MSSLICSLVRIKFFRKEGIIKIYSNYLKLLTSLFTLVFLPFLFFIGCNSSSSKKDKKIKILIIKTEIPTENKNENKYE